jgi:hypothetical protein
MAALVGMAALFTVAAAQVESLEALAQQAHVDVTDLQGAVNTTGLEPKTYLQMTGELPLPEPGYGIWDRLANCESNGNWAINSGNGYYGGLQEDLSFWRRYGGLAYASTPNRASRAAQIIVAQRGQAVQGWRAWPACSRLLGLR